MKKFYRIFLLLIIFIFLSTYSPNKFDLTLGNNSDFFMINKIQLPILITGASGFIGSNLLRLFVSKKIKVIDKTVVVVLSGGNIDRELFSQIVTKNYG